MTVHVCVTQMVAALNTQAQEMKVARETLGEIKALMQSHMELQQASAVKVEQAANMLHRYDISIFMLDKGRP